MKLSKEMLEAVDNPFALDFESYNAYGERLHEDANYKGEYKGYSVYKDVGGG